MTSLFPREEHAEALFHRILSNPGAEQQLYETFCMEQENASFERFCRLTRTAIFLR